MTSVMLSFSQLIQLNFDQISMIGLGAPSYLYPSHPLLHETHVGDIYTPYNHFWSSTLYGGKPSSSPVPAAVSRRIPNSLHHQRQHRHVCVLWRGMLQAKEGIYILARELL